MESIDLGFHIQDYKELVLTKEQMIESENAVLTHLYYQEFDSVSRSLKELWDKTNAKEVHERLELFIFLCEYANAKSPLYEDPSSPGAIVNHIDWQTTRIYQAKKLNIYLPSLPIPYLASLCNMIYWHENIYEPRIPPQIWNILTSLVNEDDLLEVEQLARHQWIGHKDIQYRAL